MTDTQLVEVDTPVPQRSATSEAAAFWVFVFYLVVAAPLILFHLGDYHWFFADEWSFVAERDGADLGDLFRSHGEHWVTLPIISYRLIYNLFGLHSYVPFQAVVVLSHLACAGLLRTVMRRAEVGPWTATVVASVFVLFGPGEENIVWAFQIAFVFALMFGLIHLIASDHDGPVDRRDWWGLGAGALGLMSSGLALVMVAVVGLAVLLRRGWRLAAFHTVPLAALYGLWYLLADPGGIDNPFGRSANIGELFRFVWSGVPAGIEAVGGGLVVGLVLSVILVAGVALVFTTDPSWRRIGPSASLFVGAFMFLAGTGYTRWFVTPTADTQSRYLYTLAAFSLPLFAVAADMIIRRWSRAAPFVLVPFAVALVLNLDGFGDRDPWNAQLHRDAEQRVLLLAHSELATSVPGYLRPNPWFTIGWLRSAAAAGEVPDPPEEADRFADEIPLMVAAGQIDEPVTGACEPVEAGTTIETVAGQVIGFAFDGPPDVDAPFFARNTMLLVRLDEDGAPSGRLAFTEAFGPTLEFAVDGLVFEPRAAAPSQALLLCR